MVLVPVTMPGRRPCSAMPGLAMNPYEFVGIIFCMCVDNRLMRRRGAATVVSLRVEAIRRGECGAWLGRTFLWTRCRYDVSAGSTCMATRSAASGQATLLGCRRATARVHRFNP
jgi:hypothetical protein